MRNGLEIRKLALLLAASFTTAIVNAQNVIDQDEAKQANRDLKEVTVSSTRSERKTDNAPNLVTVTTAEEIQELGARNIGDVFKDSPDVTVPQQTGRFSIATGGTGRGGQESINIRGLQGNNVLLLVDGIRIPNQFSFSAFQVGRGNFLDVDGFRKIEVVRGPSSTQYGSDGLAGVVNFQTFNPADLIKKGEDQGGFVRSGYSSVDNSSNTSLAYAEKNDRAQGMVLGNFQAGHQYENKGSDYSNGINRSAPNPANYGNYYLLSKGTVTIDSRSQIGITYETQHVQQSVSNLSDLGVSGGWGSNNVVTSTTQDSTSRNRISAEYDHKDSSAEYLQKVNVMAYYQAANVTQDGYQQRVNAPTPTVPNWRGRNNTYTQDTKGINALLESNSTVLVNQRLTYGLDWSSAAITGQMNTSGYGSEAYPLGRKPLYPSLTPIPSSTYELSGAFLQSEMEFDTLSIIPGVRYDAYSIKADSGAYPSNSASAISPRIGTIWNWMPEFRPFANWGTGFSAPTPDQALSSYNPFGAGAAGQYYTLIPNPALKPQTGNGVEAGTRGRVGNWRYQFSGYVNNYHDFIAQVTTKGNAYNPINPAIYQYQNLNHVYIRGWDVRTDWNFSEAWQANAAMAYSHGQQMQNGIAAPLNTTQPLRAIFGLRYDSVQWGAFANLIWNQGKSASTVNYDTTSGGTENQFLPPAFTVLNLTGYWRPAKQWTINANLNNLFNSTYWNWSGVQGSVTNMSSSTYNASAAQQSATAAPRNIQVSVRYDF
ncbi:TonB-dependent hemoglobin/transferrin/lactoferrin family receptor [Polynucleobacter sp. CS-Odin-A6]|uniref:TonB-dependent hemoglobin/transferrin/lactoferrin family receptor n=1 Tax=Polynucleobacter sp. CS-Odin-A6 TaxID=2689106 RepID=UPI001C0B8A05|nr:TonB-dependent hemoglobin/transferrin/lactoferrin family receptor [Polynucleobacter sp. CS-Odin-A6]MBU3621546.1 TonB-dependent hemoglobin/transferrin/lactoferrin family receptor [Polynucleobacter sp. CS-Odin-A6]